MSSGGWCRSLPTSRLLDGVYQACYISFEYHLHLMPGSLVVADTQKSSQQENPLKTRKCCLLGETRTPVTVQMCPASHLFWWQRNLPASGPRKLLKKLKIIIKGFPIKVFIFFHEISASSFFCVRRFRSSLYSLDFCALYPPKEKILNCFRQGHDIKLKCTSEKGTEVTKAESEIPPWVRRHSSVFSVEQMEVPD